MQNVENEQKFSIKRTSKKNSYFLLLFCLIFFFWKFINYFDFFFKRFDIDIFNYISQRTSRKLYYRSNFFFFFVKLEISLVRVKLARDNTIKNIINNFEILKLNIRTNVNKNINNTIKVSNLILVIKFFTKFFTSIKTRKNVFVRNIVRTINKILLVERIF